MGLTQIRGSQIQASSIGNSHIDTSNPIEYSNLDLAASLISSDLASDNSIATAVLDYKLVALWDLVANVEVSGTSTVVTAEVESAAATDTRTLDGAVKGVLTTGTGTNGAGTQNYKVQIRDYATKDSVLDANGNAIYGQLTSDETDFTLSFFDSSNNPFTMGVGEVGQVITVADVAGSLGGKYWTISTVDDDYYVWYNTGSSTDPAPVGFTEIEVAITTNDTAATIATATKNALNGVLTGTEFTATTGTGGTAAYVYVDNVDAGSITDADDVDTSFTISTTQQGVDLIPAADVVALSQTLSGLTANSNHVLSFYIKGIWDGALKVKLANGTIVTIAGASMTNDWQRKYIPTNPDNNDASGDFQIILTKQQDYDFYIDAVMVEQKVGTSPGNYFNEYRSDLLFTIGNDANDKIIFRTSDGTVDYTDLMAINQSTVRIYGDLIVDGEVTTINSNNVNIGDNMQTWNADITGSAQNSDAFLQVKRVTASGATGAIQSLTLTGTSNGGSNQHEIALDTGEGTGWSDNDYVETYGATDPDNDGIYQVLDVFGDVLILNKTYNTLTSAQAGVAGNVRENSPAIIRWNESSDAWQIKNSTGTFSSVVTSGTLSLDSAYEGGSVVNVDGNDVSFILGSSNAFYIGDATDESKFVIEQGTGASSVKIDTSGGVDIDTKVGFALNDDSGSYITCAADGSVEVFSQNASNGVLAWYQSSVDDNYSALTANDTGAYLDAAGTTATAQIVCKTDGDINIQCTGLFNISAADEIQIGTGSIPMTIQGSPTIISATNGNLLLQNSGSSGELQFDDRRTSAINFSDASNTTLPGTATSILGAIKAAYDNKGTELSKGYQEIVANGTDVSNDYVVSTLSQLPTSGSFPMTPATLRGLTNQVHLGVYLNGMRFNDSEWNYNYASSEKRITFNGADNITLVSGDKITLDIMLITNTTA